MPVPADHHDLGLRVPVEELFALMAKYFADRLSDDRTSDFSSANGGNRG